jgi:sugar fermentation stimulation protein A
MLTCSDPNSRVRLSVFNDPKRTYPHRLDLVHNGQHWIGVYPNLANDIVHAAIQQGRLFSQYCLNGWQREVKYADNHRIDFLYQSKKITHFVEVKSVTYVDDGVGYFPDAPSVRSTRQLAALATLVRNDCKATILYCVQRPDTTKVLPARHIDLEYAKTHDLAMASGVDALVFLVQFDEDGDAVFVNVR